MAEKPPLYKELLVGLMVGGLLGPLVGWFIGTFAAFFAVTAIDTANVRGMRGSGFLGGLLGIPLGFAIGLIVSLPLRLGTSQLKILRSPWFGAAAGAVLGWACGYVILRSWYPSWGSLVYVVMHSMVVGAAVGCVTVMAKPKWL